MAVGTLTAYRTSSAEREREQSLLALMGEGESALDIGTHDGHYARLMTQRYRRVIALDLSKPSVPDCENVAGDVCNLHQFADRSIDLVFCAEVLEHIPDIRRAASEIARVAKKRIVIGVPYRQDIRLGRVTCQSCGQIGPPWGHVNSFNEKRLAELFPDLRMSQIDLVGSGGGYKTTAVAARLMDYAGNPWGTYSQRWKCPCGEFFRPPEKRTLLQKAAGQTALAMNRLQRQLTERHAAWIHVLFTRT
jgi:SAM-dependent methyltransferase